MANLYLTNCPKCNMLMRGANQVCRYCAADEAAARSRAEADKARADLELLLKGKEPLNFREIIQTPVADVDLMIDRETEVRERKRLRKPF